MKLTLATLLLLLLCHTNLSGQSKELLIKKWDLTYFSAIDKIESSLAMQLADGTTFNQFVKSKKMILDDFYYQFFADGSMKYCDIENAEMVIRDAYWKLDNDILTITEFKRSYERKAKILQLSENSMEFVPITNDIASPDSKMIFKKIQE